MSPERVDGAGRTVGRTAGRWPRTLVGRHALLLIALLLVAQLASAVLVRQLVMRPRIEQVAEAVARQVAALRRALATLPPAERTAFADVLARGEDEPDGSTSLARTRARPPRAGMVERHFLREVQAELAARGVVASWQRAGDRWRVRVDIGEGAERTTHALPIGWSSPVRGFTGAWLAASLVTGALAIAGALAIQRRLERPLRDLVAAARRLGAGGRPDPLPEDGPQEIATVARSFNRLVADLDRASRERALLLAGISHDVRTPLAKLRLGVEILAERASPELQASLERSIAELDAIVAHFLDEARRADGDAPLAVVPVDLAALARDAVAAARDHGRDIAFDAPRGRVIVPGDATLLGRALRNLVENAFRHGRPPVRVGVGVEPPPGSWARLEVSDAGDGIAPAAVDAVMRPWVRGAGAAGARTPDVGDRGRDERAGRDGDGLGLAIVERIARRHGGRLNLLPSQQAPPRGLRARLLLPIEGDGAGGGAVDAGTS